MGKWHETQEAYFGQTDSSEKNTGRVLPILFNTEMIRAILDGRKTVTRRALKHPFEVHPNGFITKPRGNERLCPYEPPYQPGDILYVRETFAWEPCYDCGMDTEDHNCCDESAPRIYNHKKNEYGCYMYRASVEDNVYPSVGTWHPSIHMPKEAARIWLKVTDVRVERLRDITEEQAKAEGACCGFPFEDYTGGFKCVWDTTIKPEDLALYGWEANPLVWVIEFERCGK